MAKREAYKAKKKERIKRESRRYGYLIDVIRVDDGRKEVRMLSEEERPRHSRYAVGFITCPFCKREDILLGNDNGLKGLFRFDYIMNHTKPKSRFLCEGSDKNLFDIKNAI